MNYDGIKTATLSHNVVRSLTVATFNVTRTDNEAHDETVGQIIRFALATGLTIETVKGYDRNKFEMTFIQLRGESTLPNGEVE